LRNIIQRIFTDNGFVELTIQDDFQGGKIAFYANYSSNATNFYLVVYPEYINTDFLSEHVPSYFRAIKEFEIGYDERMDKNLSMLVCVKADNFDEESLSGITFEIEEDPYFFKKYVIVYNDNNLTELNKKFITKEKDSNTILNEIVNDTESFLSYKNGESKNESLLYEIGSNLMIKIPFLRLEKKTEKMEDLSKEIAERLIVEGIQEFNKSLLGLDNDLKKLSIEEIMFVMDGETIE